MERERIDHPRRYLWFGGSVSSQVCPSPYPQNKRRCPQDAEALRDDKQQADGFRWPLEALFSTRHCDRTTIVQRPTTLPKGTTKVPETGPDIDAQPPNPPPIVTLTPVTGPSADEPW